MKLFSKDDDATTPKKERVVKRRGKKSGDAGGGATRLGGDISGRSGITDTIRIDDSAIEIDDKKALKRERKGKSGLTLGEKYSGRRKLTVALGVALVAAVLMSLLAFMTAQGKPDSASISKQVKSEVANSTSNKFPVGTSSMWLEQFLRTWGTWNYKTADARATDLSPFLAPGMEPQAGWNGQGSQSVLYATVSSTPQMVDSSRAIFDTAYQIQDGTWRCMKVPVYAYHITSSNQGPVGSWGFAVTSNPTPSACPLRVSVPSFSGNTFAATDAAAATELQTSFFPGFFSAWVTSNANALQQYMGPNTKSYGLGNAYTSNVKVDSVVVPLPEGVSAVAQKTIYSAYATVELQDATGAVITTTYKVPVMKNGSQWQAMGEPSAVPQGLSIQSGSVDASQTGGRQPHSTSTPSYATPSASGVSASATEKPEVSSGSKSSSASAKK